MAYDPRLTDPSNVPGIPVPVPDELAVLGGDVAKLLTVRDSLRLKLAETLQLEQARLRQECEELERRCNEAQERLRQWNAEYPAQSPPQADIGLNLARETLSWVERSVR